MSQHHRQSQAKRVQTLFLLLFIIIISVNPNPHLALFPHSPSDNVWTWPHSSLAAVEKTWPLQRELTQPRGQSVMSLASWGRLVVFLPALACRRTWLSWGPLWQCSSPHSEALSQRESSTNSLCLRSNAASWASLCWLHTTASMSIAISKLKEGSFVDGMACLFMLESFMDALILLLSLVICGESLSAIACPSVNNNDKRRLK